MLWWLCMWIQCSLVVLHLYNWCTITPQIVCNRMLSVTECSVYLVVNGFLMSVVLIVSTLSDGLDIYSVDVLLLLLYSAKVPITWHSAMSRYWVVYMNRH